MSREKGKDREVLQKALLSAVTLGASTLKEVWQDALNPQDEPEKKPSPAELKKREEICGEVLEEYLLSAATLGTSTLKEVWQDMLNPSNTPNQRRSPEGDGKESR